MKSTKKALLLSVLSLVLCLSMLIGTTFAWFTDSVSSANNIIAAGNLDVAMYWADGAQAVPTDASGWTDASMGAIFNYDLWEPGYTQVRHIKIANEGTLALKYKVSIVPNGVVSDLADVIDVYYIDPAVQVANRAELTDANKLGTLTQVLAKLGETGYGELLKGDSDTITIAFKMQESAGNEYQNKAIGTDFSVQLLATQLTAEDDSFNNQYDKDSEFAVEVRTADELAEALKAGGKVKLASDIATNATLAIPAGVAVELDLNGNQLTFAGAAGEYTISNEGGTLTISGGEVEGVIYTAASSKTIVNDGTFRARQDEKYVFLNNQGTLEFNGGTVYGGTSYPIYSYNANNKLVINDVVVNASFGCINAYGLGGVVEINGGTFEMTGVQGNTSHIAYFSNVDVTVNGGNFNKIGNINMSATGGGGVCVIYGADVTVNGGVFSGDYDDIYNWGGTNANGRASKITLKGGTFSVEPKASVVAPGYQVTNNGDGTYTVGAYTVSTGAELVDAIANGKAVELTQDVNIGKIDLTGAITNDVVIDANGHKITTTDAYGIEVTAGKNVTISNADIVMTKAGDYITYAAGFKIANGDYAGATITLANCTITMANTDWAYAVTMPASVKNLNLVIDNCTLEGAVALQCWGDNNTITITNSKLICNYTTSAMYTSYCVALQGDGTYNSENNTLVIDNCEFLYSGIDNFNSKIYAAKDVCKGNTGNTVTVTNCTYGEKVVAD